MAGLSPPQVVPDRAELFNGMFTLDKPERIQLFAAFTETIKLLAKPFYLTTVHAPISPA
jgi:hypothetical protein